MSPEPPAVSQSVTFQQFDATGTSTEITAQLEYCIADPYAVTASFVTDSGQVRWTFARELLCRGVEEPSGDGDIHVWPCLAGDGRAVVIIELCAPKGAALMQAQTCDVARFVDQTAEAVPIGEESDHLEIDALIEALLESQAHQSSQSDRGPHDKRPQ